MLLSPPIAFIIILILSWILSYFSSFVSFKRKGKVGALSKPYAGGENVESHRVQPDYGQFFPFAFFFTILHVISLIVATVPTQTLGSFIISAVYILGGILGLMILFRKD